eukprot:GFKZ01002065.1.p1 GENE.GFKZ01002065.1~~GFKZ01002065.1.p1  ORF type:complete len:647 (-),score=81.99 GFKZ01002065.1:1458-3398(-)
MNIHPNNPQFPPAPDSTLQPATSFPLAAKGTKIDIKVSGRDLVSLDGISPATFAVVFSRTSGKTDWQEISRSETIGREQNPDYRRIFQLEYHFELYQELRIVLFERNTQSDNLQQQTMLGVADCTLGKVVSANGQQLEINLYNATRGGYGVGRVLIKAEEIISAKKAITLEISLSNLMSEEVAASQNAYLDSLRAQANAPIEKPTLQRRGPTAIINRFRKEPKQPLVLPAHLENQVKQEEQSRAAVHQQIEELETAPPPFVPFLSIMRAPKSATALPDYNSPSIEWEEVYKSMQIKDYTDLAQGVKIDRFTVSEYDLTEGYENRVLKIAVVQVQSGGPGTVVSHLVTNFPALKRMCTNAQNPVISLVPRGDLTVHYYNEEVQPSFMEYIKDGWCDFGLICAIDFTSSNGDPMRPGTRHYNPPVRTASMPPNEYEAAMRAVGNMLASYSSDSRIPAYGFGANLPPQFSVSHCFPVTEQEFGDPFCSGVDGLVNAYRSTLNRVQLYGPTIFSEVLRTVGVIVSRRTEAAVRAGNNSLPYTVLLVLTDGVISDYDATVAELIKLSALPLSIVVIGLGTDDFSKMQELDSSNGVLRRGAEFALREFVQFVPFQEFRGDLSSLAEKVLGGIPDQVISYIQKVRGGNGPVGN